MNCAICGKPTTNEDPWERMFAPDLKIGVLRSEHRACSATVSGTIGERTRNDLYEKCNLSATAS
jgi:hypothetical protein